MAFPRELQGLDLLIAQELYKFVFEEKVIESLNDIYIMQDPCSEDSCEYNLQSKDKRLKQYHEHYWFPQLQDPEAPEDFGAAVAAADAQTPKPSFKGSLSSINTSSNPLSPERGADEAGVEATIQKYKSINFDKTVHNGYGTVLKDTVRAFASRKYSKMIHKLSKRRNLSDKKIKKMKAFYEKEASRSGIGLNKYYELLQVNTTSNVKNTFKDVFREFSKWYLENKCLLSLKNNPSISKDRHIALGRFIEFVKNIKHARNPEGINLLEQPEIQSDSDDRPANIDQQ